MPQPPAPATQAIGRDLPSVAGEVLAAANAAGDQTIQWPPVTARGEPLAPANTGFRQTSSPRLEPRAATAMPDRPLPDQFAPAAVARSSAAEALPSLAQPSQIQPTPPQAEQAAVRTLQPLPDNGAALAMREVPFRVAKAITDRQTDLTVTLRPAELGQLTIRLQFVDGQLQVEVRADRPETLHLLQREADGFERALRQAGLDLRDGGLQFSAQGDGGRHRPGTGGGRVWHDGQAHLADDDATLSNSGAEPPNTTGSPLLNIAAAGSLDLRI